jgi:glycosyltransferase involved in cell wall biosynthesis
VRPLFFRKLATTLERRILRGATGIVFVSSRFKRDCEVAHGALPPSVVSPNCADGDVFDPKRFQRDTVRQTLGIETDAVVVGYVGAFVLWHGVHWYVDAISERIRENPKLILLMVGDGRAYEQVRETVVSRGLADRVLLPGRVSHERVPEVMSAMDFAVLPDSNEFGSPMKLFEFMAMGVPVLAPDLPPIAEVIEDGQTGWLFPRRDVEACIDATMSMANDPTSVRAVGKRARARVLERHQWTHNAREIVRLAGRSPRGTEE